MKRLFTLFIAMSFAVIGYCQQLPLIPYPQKVTKLEGTAPMSLTDNISFVTNSSLKDEGYTLSIKEDDISISYKTEAGKFNALQTLEQLKMTSADGTLPQVVIEDFPLLDYRGFMLDCSRHFFTKDAVKRILKIMSFYKINKFHWHLNDDQGWRVEIPEYPKLTEVGSIRKGSLTLKNTNDQFFYDDTEYGRGCYYTLDDLREVVEYANSLNIEIIPEYDLPGHNVAAIASYPELSCDPSKTYEVRIAEGISTDVLNVGDDKVIDFLKCVLGHLAEVFPSKYIHLGGDECPTTAWQTNAQCQQRIKDEGLSSVNDLQPWLLEKLGTWLKDNYGKQVVAWDELVANWKTSYKTQPIIMVYRSADYAKAAANKGLRSIIGLTSPCYLDQMQCSTDQAEFDEIYQGGYGPTWVNSVDKIYALNPLDCLSGQESYCWGTQGSLWTEACVTEAEMQYQFLPRMLAVAENGWLSKDKKNWNQFHQRLQYHDEILDALGYTYAKHYIDPAPQNALEKQQAEAKRLLDATKPGEVGYVSQKDYDELKQAYEISLGQENTEDNATDLNEAINTYKVADVVMPIEGGAYKIESASLYYLQRYLGSTVYLNEGAFKFHFTPQTEPEEIWICNKNEDGTYSFTSALDGTKLVVNNKTTITLLRPTKKNVKYDYDPGVLLFKYSTKFLYANANGTVTSSTEQRVGYPSSWRLVEITDFTEWLYSLLTKCEREVENWKPDAFGYRSQEAIDYLNNEVIAAIAERLKENKQVSREEYETFVALYEKYLEMPKSALSDFIDEGCYYYLQNCYFTTSYAYTANATSNGNINVGNYSTDDKYRWYFIKNDDGTVIIRNKVSDRTSYVSASSSGSNVKVTTSTSGSTSKYPWSLEEIITDQGMKGIAILDKTGEFSWYGNPNSSDAVILRPKEWGASIWNFIKIEDDFTGITNIPTSNSSNSNCYDLQGRRLNPNNIQQGIYIFGDRKVIR